MYSIDSPITTGMILLTMFFLELIYFSLAKSSLHSSLNFTLTLYFHVLHRRLFFYVIHKVLVPQTPIHNCHVRCAFSGMLCLFY